MYRISEEVTRKEMIDPSTLPSVTGRRLQLEKASWYLRAVQSVFLQKRYLETADLYEPPLDMFGADAVERLFTEQEVGEVVEFANRLAIERGKP